MDKQSYRLKCRLLANKIAKMRLKPHQISGWLSKQKWFMMLNGVQKDRLSKNGAFGKFGREWCDKCWVEELIYTGVYEPQIPINNKEDINSFFKYKLKGE